MKRMDDESLLSLLQSQEEDSATFTWGTLAAEREQGLKEYYRQPYGNEEEGWSSIVTSDVQDTVEWILPALLKIFTSTDQAVSFDPTRQEDVDGAAQATDACNFVFYKQNNGFLTLYTAFKDALLVKNCAVMWRNEEKRVKNVTPVKNATHEMLAMILQQAGEDAEVEAASDGEPQQDEFGQMVPTINARICTYAKKKSTIVEVFPPDELLIKRDWTSPLLDKCPYVARLMRVTLSDLHEMGFDDVTAEDLEDSEHITSADANYRQRESGSDASSVNTASEDDASLTQGILRIEFVLVDYDGDGIAERRCVYRLKDKILKNEEASQVPIATTSPILNPHRWDGLSVAECVSDLQQLRTELTRQMLNSAYLANSPRTKVLTDANWSPLASIDDLLDSRPGAILRQRQGDAIQESVTPWVGGQMFPMLEYIDSMREQRTGVSRASQGMDANVLRNDRTAVEVQQTANAAAARIELIARIFAETLIKPMFKGILKCLTEGEMEPLAFRLRNEFVEYDPQEWRDSYDMTINVGLGTGDKQQQAAMLQNIFQQQGAIGASPLGKLMVKPKNVYHTLSKIVENAGFKNIGDFYEDPGDAPIPEQAPPPDPQLQIAQMKMQSEQQSLQLQQQNDQMKFQAEATLKQRESQMQMELQSANDERDAQRELMTAQHKQELENLKLQLERYKTDADNKTRIQVALINKQGEAQAQMANDGEPMVLDEFAAQADPAEPTALAQAIEGLAAAVQQMGRPRRIIRDESGRAQGIE